jgi:hypothetical protein
LQRQLQDCKNNPNTRFVTPDEERSFKEMLARRGVRVSEAEVHRLFNIPPDRKDRALEKAVSVGLHNIHLAAVAALERQALKLRPTAVKWTQAKPKLLVAALPEESDCENLRMIIDTLGVIIALNGIGCVLGCVPCCGIVAGSLLIEALLVWLFDAVCGELMTRRGHGNSPAILEAC